MSIPYYYSENSSPQDPSLDLFFRYAKQKLANISETSRLQDPTNGPNSLLKAFQSPYQPSAGLQDSRPPTKHSLESCLQFPFQREYKSPLVNPETSSPESIRNPLIIKCLEGYVNKAREMSTADQKSEITLNRLKLNEFLFNQDKNLEKSNNNIDYSNIKEYKFSQTVSGKGTDKEFTPVKNGNEKANTEKTKKAGRNFLTPNKVRENPAGVNEFPLNELSATLKPNKKHKKKIFDLSNLEELKKSNLQPYFEKLSGFLQNSTQKDKTIVSPDTQRFYRKFRIVDKDGEDKSRIFLKRTLLDSIGVIFENFELKIAMKTQFFENQSKDEHGLLIMLYYCNKNKGDLQDCSLRFDGSKTLEKVRVFPAIESFVIEGNSTKRQDFMVESFEDEDELVNLSFEYKNEAFSSHQIVQKVKFPLPMPVTKFMEFKPIDITYFRNKWRFCRFAAMLSEPRPMDTHVLMIPDDIHRYFPFIFETSAGKIRTKAVRRWGERKYGGFFSINSSREFLIKVKIIEDFYICFEIRAQEEKGTLARKILETLCFLFCIND